MLETARRELRKRIASGAPAQVIDAEVDGAAPWLDEEQRSALWLYAWHCADDDGVARPPRFVPRDGLASE